MTQLADIAPRRPRHWLIALPLAIVVALGAAWTALWFYAAGEAEKRLNDWQDQQAKGGRVFTCAQPVGRRLSVPHRGDNARKLRPN